MFTKEVQEAIDNGRGVRMVGCSIHGTDLRWLAKAEPEKLAARYHGRGPAGNLRNFAAMGDAKFSLTYRQVMTERNDPEAMEAVQQEDYRRSNALMAI